MAANLITSEEVAQKLRSGEEVAFLDVREQAEWEASEMVLPAAIRVPPEEMDQSLVIIPHGRPIVIYASKGHDETSVKLADRLVAHGWEDVHALEGGFDAWKDAGHPVEEKSEE